MMAVMGQGNNTVFTNFIADDESDTEDASSLTNINKNSSSDNN